jgi:antitoxin PrlF
MKTVLVSKRGQVVLPAAVRRAMGLTPGVRVKVELQGESAVLSVARQIKETSLKDIQALFSYPGPSVSIRAMRV